MAAKMKMLKFVQEIRGFAEVTNRRPPPRRPGLLLTQIRVNGMQESLRRRKLNVAFDKPPQPDMPHHVKINHVKPSPEPGRALQGP
jgi:hypothetical protein